MHTNHLCLNMLGISFLLKIRKVYIIASPFFIDLLIGECRRKFRGFFRFHLSTCLSKNRLEERLFGKTNLVRLGSISHTNKFKTFYSHVAFPQNIG